MAKYPYSRTLWQNIPTHHPTPDFTQPSTTVLLNPSTLPAWPTQPSSTVLLNPSTLPAWPSQPSSTVLLNPSTLPAWPTHHSILQHLTSSPYGTQHPTKVLFLFVPTSTKAYNGDHTYLRNLLVSCLLFHDNKAFHNLFFSQRNRTFPCQLKCWGRRTARDRSRRISHSRCWRPI